MKYAAVVLAVFFLQSGCAKKEQKQDLVMFDLKGVVVAVNYQQHRIMIDHEEIPNYMMAMTMPFKVKDTTLLYKVQPGDTVKGTLAVSRTESWIETLAVISKGETPGTTSEAMDKMFRRLYRKGDILPDFSFVNQDGKRIHLKDYRGQVVAITFIYTRCPLPDFCIRMSNHFAQIQKKLSADPLLANKWHLLTISFDPKFDSPAVLKSYSRVYTSDLHTWDFATDSMKTIMDIADGLELVTEDDEGGLIAHNLRTAVLDQRGVLVDVYKGNEWTPEELQKLIVDTIRRKNS